MSSTPRPAAHDWLAACGNPRQLGSVRALRLDDGPEAGQRAIAFSTGGGLDFWLLPDRSLDIGPLWWKGMPLAWQHPTGFSPPTRHDPCADGGTGMQRSLSGFLVTCGFDNVRQAVGERPLHGSQSLLPMRVLQLEEDLDASVPVLRCVAEGSSAHLTGPSYRLRRCIEAPLAGNTLRIHDRIQNIGMEAAPFGVLHHINLGYPAVQADSTLELDGRCIDMPGEKPAIRCIDVSGRAAARTTVRRNATGPWPGLQIELISDALAQPFMQFWSDPRPGRHILALEPATCDRAPDGTSRAIGSLAAGESWSSTLQLTFTTPGER